MGGDAHRTEHWPEGEQLVTVVAATATPGAPARIVTLLQNELLSLEVGVLIGHPTGERYGKLGGICPNCIPFSSSPFLAVIEKTEKPIFFSNLRPFS